MQAFLVYVKPTKQGTATVNQVIKEEKADPSILHLGGGRDYIVNEEGTLYRVVEKVVNLKSNEVRVLVRPA